MRYNSYPGAAGLPDAASRQRFQLLHDARIGAAGIIFKAVPLHLAPAAPARAANRDMKRSFSKPSFGERPRRLHFALRGEYSYNKNDERRLLL